MPTDDTYVLNLARSLSERLAGGALPPAFAKLYSQHTRLDAGQPGLSGWSSTESQSRVNDALQLVEAAFIERDAEDATWIDTMRRAAELLEWLSHPRLQPEGVPVELLAAAAYQLAGYPARAGALLHPFAAADGHGGPLAPLLRGDFPLLLQTLVRYWSRNPRFPREEHITTWDDETAATAQLRKIVEEETSSALGILCAAMRWGGNDRVDAAIQKLVAVSRVMLNGRDRYSWLVAKLTAETARTFIDTSLRNALVSLRGQFSEAGVVALERYLRQAYQGCRTQAWPSQVRGIARLGAGDSFVLCTPTGSGKTTVAELAILQSLFSARSAEGSAAPLVMYLVPSRALAAEVEAKLSRVIAPLSHEEIVVTGLYGGIDWGPTDAWLTTDNRTVLICTYEKAEALIRFLGPLFLSRLSLVVLDEAHMIQFDGKNESLETAENRSLRLESLISRLFVHIPPGQSRVVALSAVAVGMEGTLARWITGNESALPERTLYRSTRQLIGRLECRPSREFQITYDLLDRADLRFNESDTSPFVPQPFPAFPSAPSFESAGPEKRLRPYLFWAAMHLVAPAGAPRRHAVLISVPQQIGGYAQDLLDLLEGDWASATKPEVFSVPTDASKLERWQRCLNACEDYFGTTSREYQLLQKGIVAHHGKMPGLMARLLIQLVDEGVVHFILATSTLSEGINLPFETVLLPSLRRSGQPIEAREFANLAGRAGRPGYATEGRCLVLMPSPQRTYAERASKQIYDGIIGQLTVAPALGTPTSGGRSALGELLRHLSALWTQVHGVWDSAQFMDWLEQTAVLSAPGTATAGNYDSLSQTLDSLDSILLAAIVELESFAGAALSPTDLEAKLILIWNRCFAHYAAQTEQELSTWFVTRGKSLVERIYPEAAVRRRLYRTGLPPRLGNLLTELLPSIREHLVTGVNYATFNTDEQFAFIKTLVDILRGHPKFAIADNTPNYVAWEDILRWWMDPTGPIGTPTATQVSNWYDYVATNFTYRFAWGVGCVLALAAEEANDGVLQPISLETFPAMGLPWIALWLKDLITWGTLDPVAAYLLGRNRAGTRAEARQMANQYYASNSTLTPNDQLDPRTIRDWVDGLPTAARRPSQYVPDAAIPAVLRREFPADCPRKWGVFPVEVTTGINWVDPAGFLLASSDIQSQWRASLLDDGDFELNLDEQSVSYARYL